MQNVASELHADRPLASKSGTLAYLAPEVYGGSGYGTAVDWWSLGVVFYECIYGKVTSIAGCMGSIGGAGHLANVAPTETVRRGHP